MPRVENVGANVSEWNNCTGDGSSTHDLCQRCYKRLDKDPHCFDNELHPYHHGEPHGTDGWQGDVAHPSYEEEWCGPQYCKICKCKLWEADDNVHYP
jgi:hypothetical protein